MKLLGAGIASIAMFGVGIGLGMIFSSLIKTIGRNPDVKDKVMPVGLLGFAMTESVALFALLISLLILYG